MSNPHDLYSEHYSEGSFWDKLTRGALRAGRDVVESALTLYYSLQDTDTPKWAKTVILGALGYFILPTDAIPDLLPGVGYADDLGALAAALGMVAAYIKDEHKERAREKLADWFGEGEG
jgi:uncharacterized membrane protein YkvA (DUF1232 family)